MNRMTCVAFALLAVPLLAMPCLAWSGTSCLQRSQDLLSALQAGHYQQASAHFDSRVKAALPADKLKQVWSVMLPLRFGPYDPHAEGQVAHAESANRIVTPLHFANGWLDLKVACNAKQDIAGFHFVPGEAPEGANTPVAKTLSGPWGISKPAHVASPLGPLPATLTLPRGTGPFAAVVLVAGSGPQDRDESIGPNKPLRDIARDLAAHGIAALRYDKRTYAHAEKMRAKADMSIDDEVTDDALTAAHQLAKTAHIDPRRVFVLGPSLGAMLAPRIGQRDPQLAGLILMAAPARSLLAVMDEQVREQGRIAGESSHKITATEQAIAAERKTLKTASPGHPPAGTFMRIPQSYWLSLHDYHQVAAAKSLHMPMLILQGDADFQVSPSRDFAQWEKVFAHDPRVQLKQYPGLSHLFMPAGKTGTVADYNTPGHVARQVIIDIAAWIKKQPAR